MARDCLHVGVVGHDARPVLDLVSRHADGGVEDRLDANGTDDLGIGPGERAQIAQDLSHSPCALPRLAQRLPQLPHAVRQLEHRLQRPRVHLGRRRPLGQALQLPGAMIGDVHVRGDQTERVVDLVSQAEGEQTHGVHPVHLQEMRGQRATLARVDALQPVSYTHLTLPTSDLV